jgi:hypothetical protein
MKACAGGPGTRPSMACGPVIVVGDDVYNLNPVMRPRLRVALAAAEATPRAGSDP